MNQFPSLSNEGSNFDSQNPHNPHNPFFNRDYPGDCQAPYQALRPESISTMPEIELPIITDANLYIKNIDYDISDDTLYNVFSKYGEITGHHIVRDAMKRSRGFGFM